jgi:hypothetical protein
MEARDLLDAVQAFQLVFDLFGDRLLDVFRRSAGIDDVDEDQRNLDLREGLQGHVLIGHGSREEQDDRQHEDGNGILDGKLGHGTTPCKLFSGGLGVGDEWLGRGFSFPSYLSPNP